MTKRTGMSASVTLQVERVVETFAAKSAKIAFHVRMAFQMPIQKTHQRELLVANAATKRIVGVGSVRRAAGHFGDRSHLTAQQRILDAVSAVDELERVDCGFRQAESFDEMFDGRNERLKSGRRDLSTSRHRIDHLRRARTTAHAGRGAAGGAERA